MLYSQQDSQADSQQLVSEDGDTLNMLAVDKERDKGKEWKRLYDIHVASFQVLQAPGGQLPPFQVLQGLGGQRYPSHPHMAYGVPPWSMGGYWRGLTSHRDTGLADGQVAISQRASQHEDSLPGEKLEKKEERGQG